jgi:type I restriction enzyme S subunit
MSNLDLDKKYVSFIVETVNKVLSDVDIFIYGSRTQGKSRDYSDVDIALKQKEKIPFEKLLLLKGLFENSTFPYKVDIVDLNSLSEEFLNIIECDLYKINT